LYFAALPQGQASLGRVFIGERALSRIRADPRLAPWRRARAPGRLQLTSDQSLPAVAQFALHVGDDDVDGIGFAAQRLAGDAGDGLDEGAFLVDGPAFEHLDVERGHRRILGIPAC
jgi:hypothetical protein